ncbi:MAG: NFACT RNA binding domain-containing protein [Bacillota bacterium]|nr:NFACT RNA binding domain-containing protein [Bacillota bacterium]
MASIVAKDLKNELVQAKIEKVQQPEVDEILLQLHCISGRKRLLISLAPNGSRVHFTELTYENPQDAPSFCMLLRKHIQSGRISSVGYTEGERIIYFDIETVNEMGYCVNKRLIAETMGKHSNLILVDSTSGKIIDALKRLSIDVNRYRQILPGGLYVAPPASDGSYVEKIKANIVRQCPIVYFDNDKIKDVHAYELSNYESLRKEEFENIHQALDYFYSHKKETNKQMQKADGMIRSINTLLDKQLLKKQRLLEDIKKANDADVYRMKAELLNANLHLCKPGDKSVKVISYYDGSEVVIELDEKLSAAKNAQHYYKKYAKLKSSAKEKLAQLETCEKDIEYLNSVQSMVALSTTYEELDLIKQELADQGFIRIRTASQRNKKSKPKPRRFKLSTGYEVLVGRSNTENDYITFKMGQKTDMWFHTKDIHGSHLVLLSNGEELDADTIYEAAGIAAYFSKGKDSENVPVDYVPLRYVKKPNRAKPGMVIFTNNKTVWVNPIEPK